MIIDTHCHIDNERYNEDLEEVLGRAGGSNVEKIIIPGADKNDFHRAISIATKYDNVYFAVGFHPYHIDQFDEQHIKDYVNHPKCVAIGECGLDYYRLSDDSEEKKKNIELQKKVFIAQINLAKKYNKPLIIHIRDASDDSKKILLENNAELIGGVLHCFNADEQLLSLAEKNFYFGIGGVITFKNGRKLKNILKKIPRNKLLIETDAPYLTPEPFRGKRNEPSYTKYVVTVISELLEIDEQEVETLTTTNANNLFFNSIA